MHILGGVKHGGNTERVEAFLAEVEAAGEARAVVASRLRRGESVPGFGTSESSRRWPKEDDEALIA